MNKKEAAIIMAYTDVVIGDFSVFHKYAEELLGRQIFIHEFSYDELSKELKQKSKPDFIAMHKQIINGE